jgi:hypothetical protein
VINLDRRDRVLTSMRRVLGVNRLLEVTPPLLEFMATPALPPLVEQGTPSDIVFRIKI